MSEMGKTILIISPVDPRLRKSGLGERILMMSNYLQRYYQVHLAILNPLTVSTYNYYLKQKKIPNASFAEWDENIIFHTLGNSIFDRINENLPSYSPAKGIFNLKFWSIRKLKSLIKEFDPHVIITELPWSVLSVKLSLIKKVPILLTLHNINYILYGKTKLQKYLIKKLEIFMISWCDYLITVNSLDKKILQKEKIETPIFISPNGIELSRYQTNGETLNKFQDLWKKSRPWIVFHGNLIDPPNKKAINFIYRELIPLVKEINFKCTFVIIGYGNHLSQFTDEHIVYLGWVDELESLLQYMDIGIVPVIEKSGLEMKVLEYLAADIPVIVTKSVSDGIDGLIHEKNCIITKLKPHSFLKSILNVSKDENLQNKLVKNGSKLIRKNYTWERCLSTYKSIIDSI